LQEGTLYPALYRMEAKGWIESEWATSDSNRRAKYYRLTKVGRKRLAAQQERWDRLTAIVSQVMQKA
jgi:DNA-binding PadR family transcriptional regulator